MSTTNGSIIVPPGQGEVLSLMGVTLAFKAVSEHTDGALTVIEYTAPPHFTGPPPHTHQHTLEAFYVLEGELTLRIGDRTTKAEAGAFALARRGTVHAFSNPSDHPARFLILLSPGGMENYFHELPGLVGRHGYPLPPQLMAELGQRYDITLPGPPGGT